MLNLNSTLRTGNIYFKNRVIVPAMASQTANLEGYVTEATQNHYKRLSQSGAAMVMLEYTYVSLTGKSEANQLGIDTQSKIAGLKILAREIKTMGAIAAIQLTHAGAKSHRKLTTGRLISPSGIAVPIKGGELEVPDKASLDDILILKNSFIQASIRAAEAGFDMIELHSAHGYGLNQWLSPITNQRTDAYGGSLKRRARLLFEIVAGIRLAVPRLGISVRIPGIDHFTGGLTIADSKWVSQELEKIGVNIINVSSGVGGWKRPLSRMGEGYLVSEAHQIKQGLLIPVIGVGGIKTAKYINEALNQKKFNLAAVGRAILNGPSWGNEVGLKLC